MHQLLISLLLLYCCCYYSNLQAQTPNPDSTSTKTTTSTTNLSTPIQQLLDDMILVNGGSYLMGCTSEQGRDCRNDERPAHRVQVDDFKMGKYEVTQAQWIAVMGENPSHFNECRECPVEQVSWEDIQVFLEKLNALTGRNFRLPTEEEWEFAARGGKKSKRYKFAGHHKFDKVAWHEYNSSGNTHIVGGKLPNELGLYDMSGNVWEWCDSYYTASYYKEHRTKPNFKKMNKKERQLAEENLNYRVLRGGSWYVQPFYCRLSYRIRYNINHRFFGFGFRLVEG